MSYRPIESYGVIGDMRSAALVGMDGSIDWCCLPNFDSPSVFGAILDDQKGGYYRIATDQSEIRRRQMYLPETNVLVTRFLSEEGIGELTDFMPIQDGARGQSSRFIVRIAKCVRGTVRFHAECRPAFDYARASHDLILDSGRAIFTAPGCKLAWFGTAPIRAANGSATSEFTLRQNESATFVLQQFEKPSEVIANAETFGNEALEETIGYWKRWVARCTYRGRWREMVVRSALALKLLTYEPTGAMIASPTCSLPEAIGGPRNFDYRYTWIRDTAFSIFALVRLGYGEEAYRFMQWLQQPRVEREHGPLQVAYRVSGEEKLTESVLHHLDGYRGSRPVRIGNAASDQLQLDIYGELIDSIYLYNKHVEPISYDFWVYLHRLLDWVCENWERKDCGIWEERAEPRDFTYSKVQCWVALDRGLRIARKRGLPADVLRWSREANRIYETVMERGWKSDPGTFVQYFGTDAVDASSLLYLHVLFVSPADSRMRGTLDRVLQELATDALVHRYQIGKGAGDGLTGAEGTFNVCSFWLAEVLARCGRHREARLLFEKMLTHANHLGLFSEETGLAGEALGNFPLALTHLGLISAALGLDRSLDSPH